MKNFQNVLIKAVSYFFILLFIYASVSKLLDFENFQVQIAQSPLLSSYAGFISYLVIIVELIIVLLLSIPRVKKIGLYASMALMVAFTIYIYLILNFSDFVPCSCGGILEKLGWTEHLVFNMVCVVLTLIGIILLENNDSTRMFSYGIRVIVIILVSSFSVIYLYYSSEYMIKSNNNFTRRYLTHPLIEDKTIDLANEHFYFAGSNDKRLFLGSPLAPLTLTSITTDLTNLENRPIKPDHTAYTFHNLRLGVKGSNFFLYDGSVPIIYRGKLSSDKLSTVSFNDVFFNQFAIIDSSRFAIRIRSGKTGEYELGILDLKAKSKVTVLPSLLEKQIDGVFDSDGQLMVDYKTKSIIYMYAYRNQFLVMDDYLKLKNRMKTIDTVSKARITAQKLSDGRTKMSSPPLRVNSKITTNGLLVFNQSNLMGKHESKEHWKNATVFDIYKTNKQEYVGSFYIDHFNNKPVSQILVTDHYLYAIIGSKLIRYQYRKSDTKYFKTGEAENLIQE